MTISFQALEKSFQDALEGFLWDQWVHIGLAGVARYGYVPFVIDPEALLLATTQFAQDDSRFMEEVLDWVDTQGHLLSVQRIKNLLSNPGIGSLAVLMEITRFVSRSRQKHWKTLLLIGDTAPKSRRPPVYSSDVAIRGMSVAPDPGDSEAFLFRMRSLFGINARAEVLTWLLTHRSGHPAKIARETGWYSKSVQAILNDLESSSLVFAQRNEREKQFRLEHERWLGLLLPQANVQAQDEQLRWFTQPPFYLACHYIRQTLRELVGMEEGQEAGKRLRAIVIRERMAATNAALEMAGGENGFIVAPSVSSVARRSGEALVAQFAELVNRLCRVMREERERLVGRGIVENF